MIILKCDRCGTTDEHDAFSRQVNKVQINSYQFVNKNTSGSDIREFCKDCVNEVHAFFMSKRISGGMRGQ